MGGLCRTITVGLQKGGVGKSTTSGLLAYFLSQDGYKVLAVDMDSQGNLTELLTGHDTEYFQDETILEAFKEQDAEPYIYRINENLHILPADDYLASFARVLYKEKRNTYIGREDLALADMLEPIKNNYHFIIIDTPPSLGEPLINSICASDFVLVVAEGSEWAVKAIPRFLKTVDVIRRKRVPRLKVIGILRTLIDSRILDSRTFVKMMERKWPDLVFKEIIKRKAATGRIPSGGLFENKELKAAGKQYKEFYKELLDRVQQ